MYHLNAIQVAVHLLATTTNVTTNNIKVPYKMLYLDNACFNTVGKRIMEEWFPLTFQCIYVYRCMYCCLVTEHWEHLL